jgi:uncharacterized protein (UPF0332 family)
MDYRASVDPNNPALLLPNKQVLLRCGVEQPQHQSFLGAFAHIYAHRQELKTQCSKFMAAQRIKKYRHST